MGCCGCGRRSPITLTEREYFQKAEQELQEDLSEQDPSYSYGAWEGISEGRLKGPGPSARGNAKSKIESD